jgi:hypothetical protein
MGTGRQLLCGHDGDATKTTIKMIFNGDWGWSAFSHAAHFERVAAGSAGDASLSGDKGGAAGTLQVENSLDVALGNDFGGHIASIRLTLYH